MKNSIIKYDLIDTYDDYIVSDYTSRKLDTIYFLPQITDPDFIDYYQLQDNQTIEQVAYELYGSTQYWDVILFVNKADPLYGMVYDFDFISDVSTLLIENYANNIYSGILPLTYIDLLIKQKIESNEDINELKRPLKIIRPGKIMDFMKILRQQEII